MTTSGIAGFFSCILCKHDVAREAIADTVKGDETGMLKVVACASCGHVQMNPPDYSLDFYEEDGQVNNVIKHYGTPLEKLLEHSWVEARRRTERFALHGIPLSHMHGAGPFRVLDVGGGYGFFASEMKRRQPAMEMTVLEPSKSRITAGRQWLQDGAHPMPHFIHGLLDTDFVARHRGAFEIVTMWHVLEHVTDPLALVRDAATLLASGGTLCIEVPNLNDELATLSSSFRARNFMIEHISYFSPHTLEILAGRAVPGAQLSVYGYQRYGLFNYIHWVRHNAPQGAEPDLFEGNDRMWLEATWRQAREATRTSDALFMTISI